jgi:hypothetical protein
MTKPNAAGDQARDGEDASDSDNSSDHVPVLLVAYETEGSA